MRLLLTEDDPLIGNALHRALRQAGFSLDWVQTADHCLAAMKVTDYDLLLLDLGLPDEDGLSLLKRLRKSKNPIPLIILTARDDLSSRLEGLNGGADDYLVKPFIVDELIARIHAVIRRKSGHSQPELTAGELQLDPVKHLARFKGEPLTLPAKEFAILQALMVEPGQVISKEKLEEQLYGWDEEIGSNTIEVHIHHLRKKLDANLIRTVRGVGYCLRQEES